jgi:hypothetical protein
MTERNTKETTRECERNIGNDENFEREEESSTNEEKTDEFCARNS